MQTLVKNEAKASKLYALAQAMAYLCLFYATLAILIWLPRNTTDPVHASNLAMLAFAIITGLSWGLWQRDAGEVVPVMMASWLCYVYAWMFFVTPVAWNFYVLPVGTMNVLIIFGVISDSLHRAK